MNNVQNTEENLFGTVKSLKLKTVKIVFVLRDKTKITTNTKKMGNLVRYCEFCRNLPDI